MLTLTSLVEALMKVDEVVQLTGLDRIVHLKPVPIRRAVAASPSSYAVAIVKRLKPRTGDRGTGAGAAVCFRPSY